MEAKQFNQKIVDRRDPLFAKGQSVVIICDRCR